jgi:hypothetical protein
MGLLELEIVAFGMILGRGKNIESHLKTFLEKKGIRSIYSVREDKYVSVKQSQLDDLQNKVNEMLSGDGWKIDHGCPYNNCELEEAYFYLCDPDFEYTIDPRNPPHLQGITRSSGMVPAIDEELKVGLEDLEYFRKIIDDLQVEFHPEWNREPYIFSLHHFPH